jgi:hypothetical protein
MPMGVPGVLLSCMMVLFTFDGSLKISNLQSKLISRIRLILFFVSS